MLKKILIGAIVSIVLISVSFAEEKEKNIKIICFGDSITLAARVTKEKSFIGILKKKLETKNISVQIINSGVSGNKINDGAARFEKSISALKPDIVIIMFGCNDSFVDRGKKGPRLALNMFKKHLNTIIDKLLKSGITPILMTTTPIDNTKVNYYPYSFHGANHFLKPYIFAVREIAKSKNIVLIDHFKDWEKYCSDGGKTGDLLFDFVHPNEAGYRRMAQKMYPALLNVIMNKSNVVLEAPESSKENKNKNLALGKSYKSSSRNSNKNWQKGLTDGKKTKEDDADSRAGGYASGSDSNFPKTVTIDLEAISEVSKVLIYNMAKYGTKTVEVSLSIDGNSFKKVGTQEFKKADGKVYDYTFPKQKARFVRITFLNYYKTGLNSHYMFLREVEVYED